MKYFLDQEFIEGFHKPWFGKRRHFIDLISIGIVAEDGREYYAISSEYNYFKADNWVIENVIRPMYTEEVTEGIRDRYEYFSMDGSQFIHISNFHRYVGKPLKQIAKEVIEFMNPALAPLDIYGYFSDYDWVLFCSSMFGRMIELPQGFPMYCRDLKQTLDERAERNAKIFGGTVNDALDDIKRHVAYPKEVNAHNALADARFNRDLYNFLKGL